MDLLISILISLITGMLSGLYSGLIMYKYAIFKEKQDAVRTLLNGFQYVQDQNTTLVYILPTSNEIHSSMLNIAMSFAGQGNKEAAEKTCDIRLKLCEALNAVKSQTITYEEIEIVNSDCYTLCNNLKPDTLTLLFPFLSLKKKGQSNEQNEK